MKEVARDGIELCSAAPHLCGLASQERIARLTSLRRAGSADTCRRVAKDRRSLLKRCKLLKMVARDGIEPPSRFLVSGFQRFLIFRGISDIIGHD